MGLDVMIDPVIAEKIEVKSLFPFFWDTLYIIQCFRTSIDQSQWHKAGAGYNIIQWFTTSIDKNHWRKPRGTL